MPLKGVICLTLCVVAAHAAVPDYIQVCARNHPDFDSCVQKSVAALTDKLKHGIPELDVPPVDPFTIDRLELADMPNFKAYATNVTVYGFSDYKVRYFHFDIEAMRGETNVTFTGIRMNSTYTVNAKILVPIEGKGNVYLTTENSSSRVRAQFRTVMRHGVKYVYLESVTTKLFAKDYNVQFDLDGGNKALYEGLQTVLKDNHKELMDATTPNLERAVSEQCLQMGNKILQHFTYDDLFPVIEN